ncbi:MAG: NepR family anti-sigma factor [Devosia sp.]
MNDLSTIRRRLDDGLGPNSDIGNKLRALYGAVQDEGIPDKLLQLLDRLDEVERQVKTDKGE